MRLVPNARRAWRWFSMQAMALAVALQGAWLAIPDDLKERAGEDTANWVTGALLALGIAGRLIDQNPENPDE